MMPPPGLAASLEHAAATTTTTASTLLATAAAALPTLASALGPPGTSSGSPQDPQQKNGECELLGPFAIIVQGALGLCALLALVFKRYRERPQRPLKIWFFDVSKQVVGSVLVHIANLLMSMLSSGQFSIKLDPTTVAATAARRRMVDAAADGYTPNPCSFYLLNLAIDVSRLRCSRFSLSLPFSLSPFLSLALSLSLSLTRSLSLSHASAHETGMRHVVAALG